MEKEKEKEKEEFFCFIELHIYKVKVLPHFASVMGYYLFLLKYIYKTDLNDDKKINHLIENYKSQISNWQLEDLLDNQMNYAIRIARSNYIEYEEMHKLFSLCDEIYGLTILGLKPKRDIEDSFEKAVISNFIKNESMSKAVAEDKVEEWNLKMWWYWFPKKIAIFNPMC